MKRFLLLFVSLLFACTTATTTGVAPAAAPAPARAASTPAEPVHVVIVGTTDVHGWFNGHTEGEKNAPVHYGGLPVFASYVAALRDANPGRVVLVDSGDLFQGTLESNIFEGEPVVLAYNALHYNAAAVGNHEFDYGPVGPDVTARKPGDDPLGALKRNASMATFPFLSANMREKANGQTPAWAKRFLMVDAGGAKIGVIGLSTPTTPSVTNPLNVESISFNDPVGATVQAASDLRAAGADAIIVIAHMGGRCSDMEDVHDVASCEREQEVMQFLEKLPAGTIDAYFAGHTHQQMRQIVNGVAVVQGLAYSREFSTIDLYVDPAQHRAINAKTNLRPLTMICAEVWSGTESCDPKQQRSGKALVARTFEGKTIAPDAKIAAILDPFNKKVEAKRNEPTGITTATPIARNYSAESPLGDLLADALREFEGVDVAFVNSGGIRANLRKGDLVYSDIFEVSPFDNYPAIVSFTGAQLREVLRSTTTSDRGLLQVSGLRYTFDKAKDKDKPAPQRDTLVSVTLANGKPLDPNTLYTVALPDFLVAGGDAFGGVMKDVPASRINVRMDQGTLRDIFIAALRKRPQPIQQSTEGRITILNDASKPGSGD